MTTQVQPPVAVTPPLPTRRNAELLLLCFAAVITVAALLIVEANQPDGVAGGVGSAVSAALRRAEIDVPCRDVGLPQEFFAQASRGEVLAEVGLTDRNIARQITGWVAALGTQATEPAVSERLD